MRKKVTPDASMNSTLTKNRTTNSTRRPLRHVFILLAALLFLPQVIYAQKARAIYALEQVWDEETNNYKNKYESTTNYTLYFVYDNTAYKKNGYYTIAWTDVQNIEHTDTIQYIAQYNDFLKGYSNSTLITDNRAPWRTSTAWQTTERIVFADSFKGCSSSSYAYWFHANGNETNPVTALKKVEGGRNLNTTNTTSFDEMFQLQKNLEIIDDVSTWLPDGNKAKCLHAMFGHCEKLKSLNVENWYTSSITGYLDANGTSLDMRYVFQDCKALKKLDVNTKEVTKEDGTTYTAWDVSGAKSMHGMFGNCESLDTLDLSKWNPESVQTTKYMFQYCKNLKEINFGEGWNTPVLTDATMMFRGDSILPSIDLSNWNAPKLTTITEMFTGCTSLKDVDLSNWTTSALTSVSKIFQNLDSLKSVDLSNWDAPKLTNASYMFDGCSSLESIDPSTWSTPALTNTSYMFQNCTSLESIDLSTWSTPALTTTPSMFQGCEVLERLSFGDNFNTAKVTNMKNMFDGCSNLKSITFGKNFTMNKVSPANSASMFANCPKLRYIDFYNCKYTYKTGIDGYQYPLNINQVNRSSGTFKDVPKTTVIYMPVYYNNGGKLNDWSTSSYAANTVNMVYTDTLMIPRQGRERIESNGNYVQTRLYVAGFDILYRSRCVEYYSEDKVDIELPHKFTTLKADYIRPMTNEHGSVILPYKFTKNDYVQPFKMNRRYTGLENQEYENMTYFTDVETVAAHTPFVFEKKQTDSDGNVHFEQVGETESHESTVRWGFSGGSISINNGGSVTHTYDDYSLTVNATRSTSAAEDTWDETTGKVGSPYVDDGSDGENTNISQDTNLSGWTTKGYYINQKLYANSDEPYFFIVAKDMFKLVDSYTTLPPHRVTFHYSGELESGARSFCIETCGSDDGVITAIKEAGLRKTEREAEAIYDMQGRKIPALQKGINIVRMSDGTVKKVIIK